MELTAGLDFRLPEYRKEVFLRFYEFALKTRGHPGAVYYVMPSLREQFGWDDEAALWYAFINGNTQNPVTSLLLHRRFPTPDAAREMIDWYEVHYARLAFDTDRRYHKKSLAAAVDGYLNLVGSSQAQFWASRAGTGWTGVWAASRAIPTFGRLSAFSYAEYLRIAGVDFDCEDLLLADRSGSRSHRNGLAKVLGRDDLDWHASNPGFDGCYTPDVLDWLTAEAADLLAEARTRARGRARADFTGWADDVSYFTLESALCTYKSWHRPNRRYPNVYNDMFHDRICAAETAWPDEDFGPLWVARAAALPPHLLLEESPSDPGCVPLKQNWYRETGEPIMMHRDWACFANGFNESVDAGVFPARSGPTPRASESNPKAPA